MEEIWKIARGFKNYEVSNLGNIRFLDTKKPLNSSFNGNYNMVSLKNNKGSQAVLLHRIIANTFLPKIQVNHINGNKLDNRVENLEWSNGSLNTKHAYIKGLAKKFARNRKFTENQILKIRKDYTGKWGEIAKLAREYNCSQSAMHELIRGESWKNI